MQQAIVVAILLAGLAWAGWWLDAGGLWWMGGWVLIIAGYGTVLGLEWWIVAVVHKDDPAPKPSISESLRAWWQEFHVAPRVFMFRQPFMWRSYPDTTAREKLPGAPVVFVHGFVCNRGFWLPWMKRLCRRGVPYTSVNLEPVFGNIDDYVVLIEEAVQRAEVQGTRPPMLVCHSMGGLAVRAWLASSPDNMSRASRIVTIGTPHRGTWLGQWSISPNGQQMREGSEWQRQLSQREREQRGAQPYAYFTCWYANTDNIVFPASTGSLPGADNRLLRGYAHVGMCFEPVVIEETLAMREAA
ncbi:hypothetical protein NBRC116584_11630 [Hydrogenophaga sp. 5NK40-0174]